MRLALISLLIIGGVSTAVACGGPMDAGSPGPAQTPNAGRDPAVMDPADEVRSDDPGGNAEPPGSMGTDPSRTPQISTSAVTTGGFLPTSSSGSSGSSGSTGGGPITGSTGTGFR